MSRNRHPKKLSVPSPEIIGKMARAWCSEHKATLADFDQHIARLRANDVMIWVNQFHVREFNIGDVK